MAAGAVSGLGWLDFLFPPLARISDFVEYDPGNAIKFTIYRLRPSGSAGDGDTLGSFTPISMVAEGPLLLAVSSSAPYKTPAELLAAARAKPGVITYGSAGVGSVAQMATEMMNDAAKVNMLHVPYKGASNALIDLAAGRDLAARQPDLPRPAAGLRVGTWICHRHLGRRLCSLRHAGGAGPAPEP